MRITNKILEAVNRGIQLALDDYQDIDPNSSISQSNDVIDAEDVIQQKIDFWSKWVDLGLPSGTLWAKYNLGVNPKKLSKPKDWYGNYYAWGELKPKDEYTWETYKFGTESNLTKYNKKDDLTELQLEDDAAYQIDNRMKMPTKEQFKELLEYTNNKWEKNYQKIKGLNGKLYISKINGEQLFIPASGYKYQDQFINDDSDFGLWTSSLLVGGPLSACCLDIYAVSIILRYDYRYNGFTIRPVLNR